MLLTDASMRRFSRSHIPAAIGLFSASAIFLAVILLKVFQLNQRGQFYFGGHVGFISDTVGGLVRSSLYSGFYSHTTDKTISAILIALFIAFFFLGLYVFFLRKEVPLFVLALFTLVSAVTLPILQHRLLHTLFPIEGAVLYYLPLYAVLLLSALHLLARLSSRRWKKLLVLALPAAIAAILSWHYYRTFNLHICYSWWIDRHDPEILEIINQDRKHNFPNRTVNLGNSWQMEPSLNFYRITRNYTWLAPVTRAPLGDPDNDYIYAFKNQIQELPMSDHIELASYPDTETVLLRANHARDQ